MKLNQKFVEIVKNPNQTIDEKKKLIESLGFTVVSTLSKKEDLDNAYESEQIIIKFLDNDKNKQYFTREIYEDSYEDSVIFNEEKPLENMTTYKNPVINNYSDVKIILKKIQYKTIDHLIMFTDDKIISESLSISTK